MLQYEIVLVNGRLHGFINKPYRFTKDELSNFAQTLCKQNEYIDQLYNGEITIDSVPTEWQEEIQRRVDERIAAEGEVDEQDISAEEALEIILGGEA